VDGGGSERGDAAGTGILWEAGGVSGSLCTAFPGGDRPPRSTADRLVPSTHRAYY